MAITSRAAAVSEQLAELEAKQAASAVPDEWVAAQIDELKHKQARFVEQDRIWATEHALRQHNYVGMVSRAWLHRVGRRGGRWLTDLCSLPSLFSQVHAVLLQLAKQGKLAGQVDVAKQEMQRKVAERKAKGQPIEVDDEL